MKRRIIICLAVFLLVLTVRANAGLLVDIDAEDLVPGQIRKLVNYGSVGGEFTLDPVDPNVAVEIVDGRQAVLFNGNQGFVSSFNTPGSITANNAFTVAVWAYNPELLWEECMINWAMRGTCDRGAQFNFGESPDWGAVTHYCWMDMGWGGQVPAAGQWHHLAITYPGGADGAERVYVNGLEVLSENKTTNLWDGGRIYLGCAIEGDQVTRVLWYSGALASIQIYDQELSQPEIAAMSGRFNAATITPSTVRVKEGGAAVDLTIQIQASPFGPPTEDISVTLTPVGDSSDVILGASAAGEAATVVIGAAEWNVPRTLTVSANDDDEMEILETFTFGVTLTSADTNYDGQIITPPVITIEVEDNETTNNPVPEMYQDGYLLDTFDISRDYLSFGTDDTPWDGLIGLGANETADGINASITTDGVLRLESTGAYWDWAGSIPRGPFLYRIVEGDFIAEVEVSDYAGLATQTQVNHNDCGLTARVANLADAGPGEDWVTNDYFPIWGVGNIWRQCDGGRTEHGNAGLGWDGLRFLQLERSGNTFHFRVSTNGKDWLEMDESPWERSDMDGLPLQVGLHHATFNTTTGWVEFDNFKVKSALGESVGSATVFEIGETSDTVDIRLYRAPTREVSIELKAEAVGDNPLSDANDISINGNAPGEPAIITFTPENWDQAQAVTITAVNDDDDEGSQMLTIIGDVIGDPNTSDPNFVGGWINAKAVITVMDNMPGFRIEQTDNTTVVAESGGEDRFDVSLLTAPEAGQVVVTVVDQSGPLQVVVSPVELRFTADDYDQPRTVTVVAVDDDISEDDPHGTTILLSSSAAAGSGYDGVTDTIDVSITENDCGAWGILWADFNGDCIVDIADLAELAANWLNCTIPNDPDCVDAR